MMQKMAGNLTDQVREIAEVVSRKFPFLQYADNYRQSR